MDMREIQRLHAQFAPDSMVIDLPRQIAALPAPGEFAKDPAPSARARWMNAGPLARRSALAVAVAAIVGMAGMGAATVYKTWRAGHPTAPVATQAQKSADQTTPAIDDGTAPLYKEINAAPARPVQAATALSASDFANAASLGLTADQFRSSMKTPTRSGTAAVSPPLTAEAERAAASPIHRAGSNREQPTVAPQPAPAPTPVASAASNAAVSVPTVTAAPKIAPVVTAAAQSATATTTAAAPAPTVPGAEPAKPAHPVRRHISRPRAEAPSEPDTPAKPAAPTRAGSTEVQMF
ncbi:hypothetical protein ParKJ_34805 [Paraburkholderia fungorum]|jgi:hypothetical protein|uniref:Uncharacterized protein n=1 Tax=Paraburkholderia fungorum TaxID=134537 RepID=A0AAP5UZW5_9BURK|nr:hypothetical protein [Paraburkholderia fungorum]MDT8842609.1 hypothetical protein [Paraburkholderia fungorum]PRZ49137.1 hypothetical protein BX589_12645 [Paraburkholderia fungorum]